MAVIYSVLSYIHKTWWRWQKRYPALGLYIGLSLLTVALSFEYYASRPANSAYYARKFEDKFRAVETELDSILHNNKFINLTLRQGITQSFLDGFSDKPYNLLIYRQPAGKMPELVIWSKNDALPSKTDINFESNVQHRSVYQKDLQYYMIKRPYQWNGENYSLIGLIPVYLKYPIENVYLRQQFPLFEDLVDYVKISTDTLAPQVKDKSGQEIIRLEPLPRSEKIPFPGFVFCIWMAAIFTLANYLFQISGRLARSKGFIPALILFSGTLIGTRMLTIWLQWPRYINQNLFFKDYSDPKDFLFHSPGDFVINTLFGLLIAVFILRYSTYSRIKIPQDKIQKYFFAGSVIMIQLGTVFFINYAFKRIIYTTNTTLTITNILNFNVAGLLSVFGLSTLMLTLFVVSRPIAKFVKQCNLPQNTIIIISSICSVILIATGMLFTSQIKLILVSLFGIVFLLGYIQFLNENRITLSWFITWLIFFSAFSAALLYTYNKEKDASFRKKFAETLAAERDYSMEESFTKIAKKLQDDRFIKGYLENPFNSKAQLEERIVSQYLDNLFFSRYEYQVHCYSGKSMTMPGETMSYSDLESAMSLSRKTSDSNLFFNTFIDGTYFYLGKIPLKEKGEDIGTIVIQLSPKPLKVSNVYVELLSQNDQNNKTELQELDFALYKKNKLIFSDEGQFPQIINTTFEVPQGETWKTVAKDGIDYIIHHAKSGNLAVVGKKKEDMLRSLSVFSYMFCFLLLYLLLIYAASIILRIWIFPVRKPNIRAFSLRARIQMSVVILILLAFVMIAGITFIFNNRELTDYHRLQLERKVATATASANERIAYDPSIINNPVRGEELVNSIANVERLVVNLYDLNGSLVRSSREVLFDRKLTSRQMNAQAFYALTHNNDNLFIHTEKIGNFDYQTAYAPLKNTVGEPVAYINIPYDSKEDRAGKKDSAALLGALLNIYVLLLLISGAVALLVANSITRPLTAIAEKLKQVKLGKHNDPLEWSGKDEIGTLINRYNEMIIQLEQSSAQLAQSEKELAWREMARQVAHEIKNPLTPMKLNIQLLERAYDTDPAKAREMYKRIASSLIEQIDNLAHIAGEFSNFAQLPQARNEKILLNDLIASIHDLYSDPTTLDLVLELPEEECHVNADRNQLIRVLNNLVKNAIQAIPESRRGRINLSLSRRDNIAVIIVSDNGTGIPEDKREKVFVPNFTTKNSGMGLGLAMSKDIIESAKGHIYFETTEGVGTRFYIELPIYA